MAAQKKDRTLADAPDAYVNARTLADAAEAIGMTSDAQKKTFRRWVRGNTGVYVGGKHGAERAVFTDDAKLAAFLHFTDA